jgi:hypothetical protein
VAGVLEGVANGLIEAMDTRDLERMLAQTDEDAQGVDEISRRWIRGEAGPVPLGDHDVSDRVSRCSVAVLRYATLTVAVVTQESGTRRCLARKPRHVR